MGRRQVVRERLLTDKYIKLWSQLLISLKKPTNTLINFRSILSQKHLIIGTFHAPLTYPPIINFYYGSTCSIWQILHDSFPAIDLDPFSVKSVETFLNRNSISVTDTIRKCTRRKPDSALDEDLIPTLYNTELKEQILHSKIKNLYFTSGFGKNGAFKNFYINVLLEKWMEGRFRINKQFDVKINDRLYTCHILLSPSGAANKSIGRIQEYKATKHLYDSLAFPPTYAFRISKYQQIFKFLK